MSNTVIHILGTVHSSSKSKNQVREIISKDKFDAILLEGVKGINEPHYSKWLNELLLILFLFFYESILKRRGSEFELAEKVAKKSNIPVYYIDLDLDYLIKKFHKWYNPFIFLFLFIIVFILMSPLIMLFGIFPAIIIHLFMADLFYFGYFAAYRTRGIRDAHFSESTKKILQENKYSKILVIFGKSHRKPFKKNFKVIDLT